MKNAGRKGLVTDLADEVAELLLPSREDVQWDVNNLGGHSIRHPLAILRLVNDAEGGQPIFRNDVPESMFW